MVSGGGGGGGGGGGISGSGSGFRNKLINGDMRFDQRNAGNAGAVYGPDRFKIIGASNPVSILAQQVALSNTDVAYLLLTTLHQHTHFHLRLPWHSE